MALNNDGRESEPNDLANFAGAGLSIVAATDLRKTASALLTGLADNGLKADAVVWTELGELIFEPPSAATAGNIQVATALFSGRPLRELGLLEASLLTPEGSTAAEAAILAPATLLAQPTPSQSRLLTLAARRLSELLSIQRLQATVQDLEQAEQLQHALFAIADLATSERDMQSLLRGLHQIVGKLMYAENFFISLYDRNRDTLRFIYFVDEKDQDVYTTEFEIPSASLENSITLAIIRYGRSVHGTTEEITAQLGLSPRATIGTPSVDFMGVPMRRGGETVGALVVQSYREGIVYTQSDLAILGFVAEHVLNAVERKRSQEELEQRVADRTLELAKTNIQLQEQMAERESDAHLQATLYRIAALTNNQESDAEFYRQLHQAVGELINADNFYIALLSADGSQLEFPYSVDVSGERHSARAHGRGLSEYVIQHGQTLLIQREGVQTLIDNGDIIPLQRSGNTRSVCWLGAPLLGSEGVMGVVVVQSYEENLIYDQRDADLLTFVSHQIASSVQRRQQAEALRKLNAELEERVQIRTRELRREITVREQIEAQLKHQVMHDPLTGLPNRVYLRDRLERALSAHQRNPDKHSFALLYLDVDRFKLFNDSLGHQSGDIILREFSSRLQECVRGPDIVSRLSGDEFAILLEEGTQPATARKIAQRIYSRMQDPIQVGERTVQASTSIGIAIGHPRYQTIDEILHDADVALYRAKAAGRQRFVLFDEAQQNSAMSVLELELELRNALQNNEFRAYFQPIVQLESTEIVGYEALIRWQHPRRGLLGPGEFLPVAEESGLIEAIDWHMYRIACQTGIALTQNGRFITINISARHFQYEDFDQRLLGLLEETGFNPARLHIEVTEGTLLADPDTVANTLERLQNSLVSAALDDFGTGYSSLSHVHRFPLNTIKIDRSFIRDLGQTDERRSLAIIEAVLSLTRSLNLTVVAEGIETEAQRQILLKLGCSHGQGFLFGRPSDPSHWLKNAE